MKYIIMCGAKDNTRHFTEINGEILVARTIRQLKENNITDIAISTNNSKFNRFKVPLLIHNNPYTFYTVGGHWIDAFYPTYEEACYIFGDVVFTDNAIKTIVNTPTDDIEFFASAPPFAEDYPKPHAEPFAFKVVNQEHFIQAIATTKQFAYNNVFDRMPIAWELWQVIKRTKLNEIDYTNYTIINDSTCDIDTVEDIKYYREVKSNGLVKK